MGAFSALHEQVVNVRGMAVYTACLFAAAATSQQPTANSQRPNFVMLLADDWGWGDVGAFASLVNNGDKMPVTPSLDQLAAEGTIFTRFHTMASVCSPSRASWLTGQYIIQCNIVLPFSTRRPKI